jgi:tetratricopeptide (TPR) repeat protein
MRAPTVSKARKQRDSRAALVYSIPLASGSPLTAHTLTRHDYNDNLLGPSEPEGVHERMRAAAVSSVGRHKQTENARVLAAVGAAVMTFGGLIAGLGHGTIRIAGVGIACIGLLGIGLRAWAEVREEHRRAAQAAKHDLRSPSVRMDQLSVEDAGADRLEHPVSYVPRRAASTLRERIVDAREAALRGEGVRMVVLRGASKAGKSRLLAEVARETLAEWTVIRPLPDHLSDCLRTEGLPEDCHLDRVVLWLDDLEDYARLGRHGLNAVTLSSYLDTFAGRGGSRVVILATQGGKGAESLRAADEDRKIVSALIDIEPHSHRVELDEMLDPTELADAIRVLSLNDSQRDQVERHGLGAFLVGGPMLIEMLRSGRAPGHGQIDRGGQHVAWLIAWWAHIGIAQSMPADTLNTLWKQVPHPEIVPTPASLHAALLWAQRPPIASRPGIALVREQSDSGYSIYGYVAANLPEPPHTLDTAKLTIAILESATPSQALEVGTSAYLKDRYEDALVAFRVASLLSISEVASVASFNLGVTLGVLDRFEEALTVYEELLARFGDAPEPEIRRQVAKALVNKGLTLGVLNRSEEELAAYDKVLARFRDAPEPELRRQVAKALISKGVTLFELDRFEEELAVHEEILARFRDAPEPELRRTIAQALINWAVTLEELGRIKDALALYKEILARFRDAPEPELREQIAWALVNKGAMLVTLNRHEEALDACDEMLMRFGDNPEPELHEQVARALVNKGAALWNLKRFEEELTVYDEVLGRFEDDPEPELRKQVEMALRYKALTLWELGRSEEARAIDNSVADYGTAFEIKLKDRHEPAARAMSTRIRARALRRDQAE